MRQSINGAFCQIFVPVTKGLHSFFWRFSHRITLHKFKQDWLIILRMSKQVLLLIVDVGYSMDEPFSETSSRAKVSFQCCKMALQQKLFNNSSHQIGLILFGDKQSDDGNSLTLYDINKPTVDLVRQVQKLSKAQFDNTRAGGDIFSAINYGIGAINKHCAKRKYNKRIFIFTNGMGQTDFNLRDMNVLADKIEEAGIKLNIIPIDFMTSYDCSTNELQGEIMLSPVQQSNSQMLMRIKQLKADCIQIFPASLAIELYKKFRKRDTNPVARYKGKLELAPGLQIEICAYKAIKMQKIKSLARYDKSAEFDPKIPDTKEVILETSYTVQGDPNLNVVDKENIINAYYYGPQLVPIPTILEAGSKIFEDKNLRLLGFIDKAKIPRHCFMSQVDLIVPSDQQISRKLFTAFIYSMISLNKYAVGRFVARNCKNGVVPKMMVLIPYRSTEREMFYMIELPTVEDVRDYPYNSLKQSSEKQKQLVRNLVDSMMLYRKDGQQIQDQLKVQNTFNPMRQYFYQTIFYRALNNDSQDIPPLDPIIRKYISPQTQKYKKTAPIMKQLKKHFRLSKKIDLQSKSNKKKTLVWNDVIKELSKQPSTNPETMIKQEQTDFVKPNFKFSADEQQQGAKFSIYDPITSFKKMISYNRQDLVPNALQQMNLYIKQKATFTFTSSSFKHLYDCASQLRNACITQQQSRYWDEWFNELSKSHENLYNYLRGEGLSLIQGDVMELFKPIKAPQLQMEQLICDLD